MRFFLDSNIITYIAYFEPFFVEGEGAELEQCVQRWTREQSTSPDPSLGREIEALGILYAVDNQAHFDWLCSNEAVTEIEQIRHVQKREEHYGLLSRMLEHRADVYAEARECLAEEEVATRIGTLLPHVPARMQIDAQQFAEADIMDAQYFLTNDRPFIRATKECGSSVIASRPSDLPFVEPHITGLLEHQWARRV